MDELEKIFKKLDSKKLLISKYSKLFKELEQNSYLSKNEIYKLSKKLYNDFTKEMKSIDKT